MLAGIGVDIARVSRFEKWAASPGMLKRFFNAREIAEGGCAKFLAERYAARFAAKEAFGKALGTGISAFDLRDVCVENDERGKPSLALYGGALAALRSRCGEGARVSLSISHEREYAVAFVAIEV